MTVEINCNDIELHMQSNSRHGLAFFNDLGKNKYTLKRVGGVIHSTEQVKAGSTSFYSPSSTNDYLRVEGVKENFNFIHYGSSDWTIQTWCYLSSTNSTSSTIMGNSWNGNSHDGFRFYIDHSTGGSKPTFTTYVNWTTSQGYKSSEITTNTSIPLNTWVHLAVVYVKSSDRFHIYIDGQDDTAGTGTWSSNVLLRPAGKSLDLFRDDTTSPNAFHGFLQDIQVISKPIYLVNFNKSDDLLFDRCEPARVNLKIPGRPEYIYFFDGQTTKCYRKTNARVYEGGITLTEDQIASSIEQHNTEKATKPVLIYDSCEQCLGLSEFYQVSSFGTIIRYGQISETQDVQNMTPGAPLIDINTYTVVDTSITVTLDDIGSLEAYYPDNPESRFASQFYTAGQVSCTVDIPKVANFVPGVTDLDPSDTSVKRPIYSMSSNSKNLSVTCTVHVGAQHSDSSAFPGVDASNITSNTITRREGTSASPAPPDAHVYDLETKSVILQPFKVTSNPGAWVSFTR